MGVGERENVTHLGGGQSLDIAQDEDFTLCGRERIDGLAHHLARLSGEQLRFRRPPLWARRPNGEATEDGWMAETGPGLRRAPTQTSLGRRAALTGP